MKKITFWNMLILLLTISFYCVAFSFGVANASGFHPVLRIFSGSLWCVIVFMTHVLLDKIHSDRIKRLTPIKIEGEM